MTTTDILKADMLDILFENRNKEYGAYTLRKYYHERLYKALAVIFLLIAILTLHSFLHKVSIVSKDEVITTSPGYLPPPIPKKKVVESIAKPKQSATRNKMNTQIFTAVIKVVDSTDKTIKPIKSIDSTVAISNVDTKGAGNGKKIVKPIGEGTGTDSTKTTAVLSDRNKALAVADIMPSYPGGEAALIKFLQKNLNNPEELGEDQVVSVKIKFIVGYDGILKGFETVEDGGMQFNNEVIRVLKKMHVWIPGKTAGENVSVYYTIPVKFVSQD